LSGGPSRQIETRIFTGTYETLAALIRQQNEFLLQRLGEQQEHLFRTFLGGRTNSIQSDRPSTTASRGNAELPQAIDDITPPDQAADGGPTLTTAPLVEPRGETESVPETGKKMVRIAYESVIEAGDGRDIYKHIDFLHKAYIESAFEGSSNKFHRNATGWDPRCAARVRDWLLAEQLLKPVKKVPFNPDVVAQRKSKKTEQINSVQLTDLGKAVVELGLKEAADGRSPFTADT